MSQPVNLLTYTHNLIIEFCLLDVLISVTFEFQIFNLCSQF